LTVKVNAPTANDDGATLLSIGVGFQSVSVSLAVALESAVLTALIAADPGLGIVVGAEYKPDALIVPTVGLPPGMSLTNQLTFWFDEPLTVGVTWSVSPRRTSADAAAIETVTLGGGGFVPGEPPVVFPQPISMPSAKINREE
jgi:hypothetical protein